MTTKEELDEAIKFTAIRHDEVNDFPDKGYVEKVIRVSKVVQTILTKYRDGELVEKDRWVSVKDRLPENNKPVLILSGKTQEIGFFTKGHEVETEDDEGDGDWYDADEFKGILTLKQGWYVDYEQGQSQYDSMVFGRNVTHWQPLPTPPTNQTEP